MVNDKGDGTFVLANRHYIKAPDFFKETVRFFVFYPKIRTTFRGFRLPVRFSKNGKSVSLNGGSSGKRYVFCPVFPFGARGRPR